MRKFVVIISTLYASMSFTSCGQKAPEPETAFSLAVTHEVDGVTLHPDVLAYTNEAGYRYSVSNLAYYISDIRLEGNGGKTAPVGGVHYVSLQDPNTNEIPLSGIPPGNYTAVSFYIGVVPEKNVTGGLLNTLDNTQMAWPDPMGGGYHFLKLEGRYEPGNEAAPKGYAMHLGKNKHLVPVRLKGAIQLNAQQPQLHLVLNINEWFRNPHTIDFETDGTYSMSDDSFMQKLSENGTGAFKLAKNQ